MLFASSTFLIWNQLDKKVSFSSARCLIFRKLSTGIKLKFTQFVFASLHTDWNFYCQYQKWGSWPRVGKKPVGQEEKHSSSCRFCVVRSSHPMPLCLLDHLLIFIPGTANANGGKLSETLFSNHRSKSDTGSKFYNDSDLFVFNSFLSEILFGLVEKAPK